MKATYAEHDEQSDGNKKERILKFCLLIAMSKSNIISNDDIEKYLKMNGASPLKTLLLGELCIGVVLSSQDSVDLFLKKKHDVFNNTHLHFHPFTAKKNKQIFEEMDKRLTAEEKRRREADEEIIQNIEALGPFLPGQEYFITVTTDNPSEKHLSIEEASVSPVGPFWSLTNVGAATGVRPKGRTQIQVRFQSKGYDFFQLSLIFKFATFTKTHVLAIPVKDESARELLEPVAEFRAAAGSLRDIQLISSVPKVDDAYPLPSNPQEIEKPARSASWNKNHSRNIRMALHQQLWTEEMEEQTLLAATARPTRIIDPLTSNRTTLLSIPNLSLVRPDAGAGDLIYLYDLEAPTRHYEGVVIGVQSSILEVDLSPKCLSALKTDKDIRLRFTPNHRHYSAMHAAIDHGDINRFYEPYKERDINMYRGKMDWIKTNLTEEQKKAVLSILDRSKCYSPFLVLGCIASGKSTILVETAQHTRTFNQGFNKVTLIVAHSEDSADQLAFESNQTGATLRFRPKGARVTDTITERQFIGSKGEFITPSVEVTKRYPIIVTTYTGLLVIQETGLKAENVSHLFMDEAEKTSIGEAALALTMATPSTRLAMVGDDKAPSININKSHRHSILCEVASYVYGDPNALRPQKLTVSFHPLTFLSKIISRDIYDDKMELLGHRERANLWYNGWSWLKKNTSTLFLNVSGVDMAEASDPSLFNIQEASSVCLMVSSLIEEENVRPEDIEIVVPFTKQKEKIQQLMNHRNLSVKVGLPGELSGPPPKVLLVSTVRSLARMTTHEDKYIGHSGFIYNPHFASAALARGLSGVIGIVGNTILLLRDPFWRSIIYNCSAYGTYWGCEMEDAQRISDAMAKRLKGKKPLPSLLPDRPIHQLILSPSDLVPRITVTIDTSTLSHDSPLPSTPLSSLPSTTKRDSPDDSPSWSITPVAGKRPYVSTPYPKSVRPAAPQLQATPSPTLPSEERPYVCTPYPRHRRDSGASDISNPIDGSSLDSTTSSTESPRKSFSASTIDWKVVPVVAPDPWPTDKRREERNSFSLLFGQLFGPLAETLQKNTVRGGMEVMYRAKDKGGRPDYTVHYQGDRPTLRVLHPRGGESTVIIISLYEDMCMWSYQVGRNGNRIELRMKKEKRRSHVCYKTQVEGEEGGWSRVVISLEARDASEADVHCIQHGITIKLGPRFNAYSFIE
ncbi:hypothetical protein PROFUN_10081 [Planoprotostelium fungivorum]|uniref:DNA2/NAM7 helicase-like C-terminal domain-containing protein n=1 Tax=Planoprotostelium fungivorum TaxID=1890364 RepID=A0A2P6NEZ9_9EUKA|nr:hypothetical protein PROFUN_10081 [Planoprotostelium fungivorum]